MFNLLQSKSTFTHGETFKGKSYYTCYMALYVCMYIQFTYIFEIYCGLTTIIINSVGRNNDQFLSLSG